MTEKEWKDTQMKLPANIDKKAVDSIFLGGSTPTL
jgi:hypothetical protein